MFGPPPHGGASQAHRPPDTREPTHTTIPSPTHLGPARHQFRTLARLGRTSLLLITTLLLATAAAQPTPARITALTANPASVEEGTYVDFTAALDPGEEGSLVHTWAFGDGVTATGIDLLAFRHRYVDDGTYTVTHTIERADGSDRRSATLSVTVSNVAPELRRVQTSHGPIPGFPVTLTAAAVDPGDDTLTYTWDFGDGTPPTEASEDRHVAHTFEAAGTYAVTVTVEDGDGGSDTLGLEVVVGDGFGYEVSGDVTARPREGATPTLTGLPIERGPDGNLRLRGDLDRIIAGDADVADGPGSCLIIVGSQSMASLGHVMDGTALTFTAALENGLTVGHYPIAVVRNEDTIEWSDPYAFELDHPGTFNASLLDVAGDGFESDVTGYHPTGGTFTIERYDGLRFEASFQLDLEESLNVFQLRAGTRARTAHAFGVIRHDVNRVWGRDLGGLNAMGGATFGDAYLCGSSGELNVVSHDVGQGPEGATGAEAAAPPSSPNVLLSPPSQGGSARRIGLPWRWEPYADGDAKLEFTFDRPMNPDTLDDRTIWLDIPAGIGPGAPFEPISGIVVAVSDTTFRFLPDWDMRPGVLYEVRILGGEDGVRGASGEILEQDYTWRFQTQVELESVVATVTQVSRGAMLVPYKPTVVRVYTFWSGYDDVPPEFQVYEVSAEVAVEVDGVTIHAPRDVVLRRWDQYGDAERRDARHTVNFFGWKPAQFGGTSTLTATVTLASEPTVADPRFESRPVALQHWDRAPTLTLDYYYLTVDAWATGVPVATLNAHPNEIEDAADYLTQNFPVVATDARWRGPLALAETPQYDIVPPPPSAGPDALNSCVVPQTALDSMTSLPLNLDWMHRYDHHLAWQLYLATAPTSADMIVGVVPEGVGEACGWLGIMMELDGAPWPTDITTRRVFLVSEAAPPIVLAHETGHLFGLCHGDDLSAGCLLRNGYSIEGFKIGLDGRSGWNKSEIEGNAETFDGGILPLMFRRIHGFPTPEARFIADAHYRRLFEALPLRGVRRPPDAAPTLIEARPHGETLMRIATREERHVSVWALVASDGSAGTIARLTPTELEAREDRAGAFRIALVDAGGEELVAVTVDGAAGAGSKFAMPADAPIVVHGVLPLDARAHALVVLHDGREVARRERTSHPPTLTAHVDGTIVRWDALDPDGDVLVADLHYAPDGATWTPLAVGLAGVSEFALPEGLTPGADPTIRLRVGDGFDSTERTVRLVETPPLRLIARSHGEGAVVRPGESLWFTFNASFPTDHDPAAIARLAGPDGQRVDVDAALLPGGRRLLVVPRAPLAEGALHIDVGAAYRAFDGMPPDGAAWQVVVEAAPADATLDAVAAAAHEAAPLASPAVLPASCGGVDRESVEALLPAGHELQEVADDAACTVRAHVAAAPERARADLEFALLRQRYLPTRNVQDGAAVVIDFEGNGRTGSFRLEPEGTGTTLTLEIGPR